MTKNNKILIGAAILVAGGYFYMQSKKPKKAYMNLQSKPKLKCPAGKQLYSDDGGVNSFFCLDPRGYSPSSRVSKVNV